MWFLSPQPLPGHPVLQTALPELMKGLGVSWLGNAVMKYQEFERKGMHDIQYGSAKRKALSIAKPLAAISILAAGLFGLGKLIGRRKKN